MYLRENDLKIHLSFRQDYLTGECKQGTVGSVTNRQFPPAPRRTEQLRSKRPQPGVVPAVQTGRAVREEGEGSAVVRIHVDILVLALVCVRAKTSCLVINRVLLIV